MENFLIKNLKRISSNKDTLVAVMVIAIIVIIVVPMPSGILDVLLAANLAFALIIILTTLFIRETLQFSVFPTLLLIATLFRLALNISSTRLILNDADAGKVIEAFGTFVVGGNYVVGMVVFIIITVIQFVVITNGAGRVAEVAARFTLDAMPGKQMSIDADLNAGIISEEEARGRRKNLQREADFFGSMDGASKFVKGDAIAGIVIAIVNIIGGLVIGVWQMEMSAARALETYTLLTVGDGLVSQLPALLISTATGIVVTRSDSGRSFGDDLGEELTAFPKVAALASVILAFLAIMPGLPFIPFMILAGGTGYSAYVLNREEGKKKVRKELEEKSAASLPPSQPENVLNLFKVDPLEVEVGYNLISLTDENHGGDLLERLAAVRRQCALEMGIFVRPIRIRDNLQIPPDAYRFKIRGIDIAGGTLVPGRFLAMNPVGGDSRTEGIETVEPTFGLKAWWVDENDKMKAELDGFTVVDASTVLITHLTEFIRTHAHELISRQDVKDMLDMVREGNDALVTELVPDLMDIGGIQRVIENLLKESVSIRDIETVFECIADGARVSKDTDFLTENVRQGLMRSIGKGLAENNTVNVLTLSSDLERALEESMQVTSRGSYPALSPLVTQDVFRQLDEYRTNFDMRGFAPAVLTSSRIRLGFRRLLERFRPEYNVIAINELVPDLDVNVLGTVVLNED